MWHSPLWQRNPYVRDTKKSIHYSRLNYNDVPPQMHRAHHEGYMQCTTWRAHSLGYWLRFTKRKSGFLPLILCNPYPAAVWVVEIEYASNLNVKRQRYIERSVLTKVPPNMHTLHNGRFFTYKRLETCWGMGTKVEITTKKHILSLKDCSLKRSILKRYKGEFLWHILLLAVVLCMFSKFHGQHVDHYHSCWRRIQQEMTATGTICNPEHSTVRSSIFGRDFSSAIFSLALVNWFLKLYVGSNWTISTTLWSKSLKGLNSHRPSNTLESESLGGLCTLASFGSCVDPRSTDTLLSMIVGISDAWNRCKKEDSQLPDQLTTLHVSKGWIDDSALSEEDCPRHLLEKLGGKQIDRPCNTWFDSNCGEAPRNYHTVENPSHSYYISRLVFEEILHNNSR